MEALRKQETKDAYIELLAYIGLLCLYNKCTGTVSFLRRVGSFLLGGVSDKETPSPKFFTAFKKLDREKSGI